VADIIRAVDEQLDATQCGGRENCHDEHRCMTHDLWTTLNIKMFEYLSSVTLAELVYREKLKHVGTAVMEDQRRLGPQPRARAGRDKLSAAV
jgi:Rrf2 family iron-sulfur cluster assembly transcriptional regulator